MATAPAIIAPDADPAGDPAPAPAAPPVADAPLAPLASDPAGDPPPAANDGWRARMAGDDDKLLGYLGRYTDEKAFVAAAKKDRDAAAKRQILKLPDNPTADEVAAYRKENGIPEKPEGYLEKLSDGLVVGDDDRPFVDQFLTAMHEQNAPPGLTDAALKTYYAIVEEQAAQQAETVRQAEGASIETLREEWGPDYKRNLNAMHGYLDTLPEPVAAAFKFGVGQDGVPLGYNADVLKWLASRALDENPFATLVPGAGANTASAIADEIAAIEKRMETDRSGYFKDEKMQARHLQLIEARDKMQK